MIFFLAEVCVCVCVCGCRGGKAYLIDKVVNTYTGKVM
jgi:hypothetical protein